MKHNKKRNTAFIYETLTRELTKAIVDKDNNRKATVLAIIKEGFGGDSTLAKELSLYKTLLETKNIQRAVNLTFLRYVILSLITWMFCLLLLIHKTFLEFVFWYAI